jgi:hypothetical protein
MWSILICSAEAHKAQTLIHLVGEHILTNDDEAIEGRKIKLDLVACFSSSENTRSEHHVYHAIHHDYTIKTPRSAPRYFKKPLQKRRFTSAKKIYGRRVFFPAAQTTKRPGSLPAFPLTD